MSAAPARTHASRSPAPPAADPAATAATLVTRLRAEGTAANRAGMRRFGITPRGEHFGVSVTRLRALGRPHRRDQALALALWATGSHEARVLAAVIADPRRLTRGQMERWVRDCDNWAVTDTLAFTLARSPWAEAKAHAWSRRRAEFVKRAAFSLMAGMAVHRKELPDEVFLRFLPVIRCAAEDDRNFVRKAVNWALRQIGKRNPRLRRAAVAEARRVLALATPAARWIARDALRELAPVG